MNILGEPLSERQKQVVCLWANGAEVKQIAEHLSIAQKTAEYHLHVARCKIGFMNLALVTKWLLSHGLITLELPEPGKFEPWFASQRKELMK